MFTIDQSLCIHCGSCVKVCPLNIFSMEEDGSITPAQKECIRCFHCTAACPVRAISHSARGHDACYPAPAPESTLLAAFQRRRSIRHFKDALPDRALIQAALDGAAYAPSAKNQQLYRWTVVLGRERVEELYRLCLDWAAGEREFRHLLYLQRRGNDPVTCGAPCVILVHTPQAAHYHDTDAVIAATLADQLLADSGLGTCWGGYLCHIANQCAPLRQLLALPEDHQVCAALLTGYPNERYPSIPPRSASVTWLL